MAHPFALRGIAVSLGAGPSLPLIEERWNSPAALQIFDKDESHLYATILAIPNYRLQATDKTVMTFAERAVGEPQAIRAWFYPGDNSGQEFFYPKEEGCGPGEDNNSAGPL
jgi:hypothetical protein